MLISIKRGLEVIIWSWSISRVFRPYKKGQKRGRTVDLLRCHTISRNTDKADKP